ncbi:hypothetical protein H5410_041101 [Solanum commersonii]|uniref:Uncharacterized protein n=1 Tax=Solanum commersonii TaxID=4109 RepID=A0A9J5XQN2_SOLCO|nr:hypothetical protein H5410_041101 [Solanum commersonii]
MLLEVQRTTPMQRLYELVSHQIDQSIPTTTEILKLQRLARKRSDHAPLLLSRGAGNQLWVEKENFKEVVKQNWLADVEDVFVQLKIKKKKTKIELSK